MIRKKKELPLANDSQNIHDDIKKELMENPQSIWKKLKNGNQYF